MAWVHPEEVQAFFFKAMQTGWTGDGEKIKIPDMPGYKALPFRDGDFYLLDRYCVTPDSLKSAGTTTIWFKDNPVWVMNYGGFYSKQAISLLKAALSHAYANSIFVGGRGPRMFSSDTLFYVNQPILNDFSKFQGREDIFSANTSDGRVGFHEYWGMSLLG